MEAIAVRDAALALHTKASQYKRPLDAVRFLEDEFGKCDQKLHRFPELKVGNSDRHMVLLQSLSSECRQYILQRTCVLASSSMRNRLAYASRLRSFMVCREMMQRKVFAGIVEKQGTTPRNARSLVPKVTLKERVMAKRRAKARVKMLMGLLLSQRASRSRSPSLEQSLLEGTGNLKTMLVSR